MRLPEARIERLNLIADGLVKESCLPRARFITAFLAIVMTLLAIGSKADRTETLLVWMMAVMLFFTTAFLWLRSKYSLRALSAAFVLIGITDLMRLGRSPGLFGWCLAIGTVCVFGSVAYQYWKSSSAIVALGEAGLEQEFYDAQTWLQWLESDDSPREVLEFSAGSFWVGYFTCRLMKLDEFWALAKFKKNRKANLLEYKFYRTDEVRVCDSPAGAKILKIAGKQVPQVDAAIKVWDALRPYASGN